MRREYSVAEMNIFAREVLRIINGNNTRKFAVVMPVDGSGNLKQYPTLAPMTLLSSESVGKGPISDSQGDVVLNFKGILSTYEAIVNGEKTKLKLPVLPALPPDQLLELGADIIEYAEALRTMIIQGLMTMPAYRVLDSESVSIILADRLLETGGMSLKIENILKNKYGKSSPEARKELDQYANSKITAPMLDKTICVTLDMFVKQFRKHADALRKSQNMVSTPKVQENGIAPVTTPARKDNMVKIATGIPDQTKLEDVYFGGFESKK